MVAFQILHTDPDFVVCIKPPRVRSTDEPGGMPELCRAALGTQDVRTVHRLDQVVSGLMVLARNAGAAAELSRQIRENEFHKEYLAVLHGIPGADSGTLQDLLLRNKPERKTYVVTEPARGVQEAVLDYEVLEKTCALSKVRILLRTGRTHQIRCQFSARNLPLVGDRKYSLHEDDCEIALWSSLLRFHHPKTGEELTFTAPPPEDYPWNQFGCPRPHYSFFQNRDCEYFPCHQTAHPERFNCLFCYCPLYALGDNCGGNFVYLSNGIKDCSHCLRPHQADSYEAITQKLCELVERMKKCPAP